MRIAVYPGSFDPITNGHLDIIERAAKLYDKVIVGVLNNSSKNPVFSVDERLDMIRRVTSHIPNVAADAFSGLLVDFAASNGATVFVKGLRTVADFEYEMQMALLNKTLNPEYETMFMMTNTQYSYISSSLIKEVAKYSGSLEGLVPDEIIGTIQKKFLKTDKK